MTKTDRIVDLFKNEDDCLYLNIQMLHNVGIEGTIVYSFLLKKRYFKITKEVY